MPSDPAEISIDELRAAAARILDATERRLGSRINLGADEYWSIFPSDAFNLQSQPPIGAGQLSDDVATIRELLERPESADDVMLLWHDLDHLTGILRRLSNLAGA